MTLALATAHAGAIGLLSAAEECDLARRRELDPEARRLASDPDNIAFARRLARRMAARHGSPIDQAESDALYGLCLAARNFLPGRGREFRAFAQPRILGAMADGARSWRFGHRIGSAARFVPLVAADDEDSADGSLQSDDLPVGSLLDSADAVEGLIRGLPGNHKVVMRMLYLECLPENRAGEVARRVGLSPARIYQIREMSLESIRDRIGAKGVAS